MSVFTGEQSSVGERLNGLGAAVEAARGRLPHPVLDPAAALVERASERLKLSGDHTIVALAGATGSGKSSLFNRLTDLELAGVGVRRPTTTWALACAWGPDGASDLLEWMGIPARHQVSRRGMLERADLGTSLEGLILLDLPDHDSTEIEHRVEMDRLIPYSDVVIWVLDPQKYADAAIHDRYIRPMAGHADTTLVVLNQIDRIAVSDREGALADVRRLVSGAGLSAVPVLAVSAATGEGIGQLRHEIAARIGSKRAAVAGLSAEVAAAAQAMAAAAGASLVPGVTDTDVKALTDALVESVGVPQVAAAIGADTRRRATGSVAWPPARPIGRRRRVAMGRALHGQAPAATVSTQLPQAELAVRTFWERAAVGLQGPWPGAVRAAVRDDFAARLAEAVRQTRIGSNRSTPWWVLVNALHWIAFLAMVAGLGWLLADRLGLVAGVPAAPWSGSLGLPGIAAAGGFAAGLGLWAVGALGARRLGKLRSRKAVARLQSAIELVADEDVVKPVRAELARYERYRSNLASALG